MFLGSLAAVSGCSERLAILSQEVVKSSAAPSVGGCWKRVFFVRTFFFVVEQRYCGSENPLMLLMIVLVSFWFTIAVVSLKTLR